MSSQGAALILRFFVGWAPDFLNKHDKGLVHCAPIATTAIPRNHSADYRDSTDKSHLVNNYRHKLT